MTFTNQSRKVGVFVDVSNIYLCGGSKMRYDVLRQYAMGYGHIQRLNAYVSFDAERATFDKEYSDRSRGFHEAIRSLGYHTTVKEVRWFTDPDTGRRYGKADLDSDIVVDLAVQAPHLDYVILVSGDGDFVRPIQHIRSLGSRVEIMAFDSVSKELRREADVFTSGYLIPELIPTNRRETPWGNHASIVRGMCSYYNHEEGYGFLIYLRTLSPLTWLTDTRNPESPYGSAFFHTSDLPEDFNTNQLPSRWTIFEFELIQGEKGMTAANIHLAGVFGG
jgi:uncharacterized LabA/DUF88 family protein/cold shock CspA family protein